jgi:hypothetical protein
VPWAQDLIREAKTTSFANREKLAMSAMGVGAAPGGAS